MLFLPSFFPLNDWYKTGITNKENNMERLIPPIIEMASGFSISAPSPMAKASGINPKILDSVVIKMGRNRTRPAIKSAS